MTQITLPEIWKCDAVLLVIHAGGSNKKQGRTNRATFGLPISQEYLPRVINIKYSINNMALHSTRSPASSA